MQRLKDPPPVMAIMASLLPRGQGVGLSSKITHPSTVATASNAPIPQQVSPCCTPTAPNAYSSNDNVSRRLTIPSPSRFNAARRLPRFIPLTHSSAPFPPLLPLPPDIACCGAFAPPRALPLPIFSLHVHHGCGTPIPYPLAPRHCYPALACDYSLLLFPLPFAFFFHAAMCYNTTIL